MIRTIIIDDEPLAVKLIEEHLSTHADVQIVACCHDGFEGLKAISEQKPDLVFLDVQMPKITGLEMLELVDELPALIFTTAFDQHALAAFERNAVDYLLKPFSKERFDESLERYRQRRGKPSTPLQELSSAVPLTRIVLKDEGRIRLIALEDINYLEAYDDYVKIHLSGEKFIKKATLAHYDNCLPAAHFVRIHRSYIVQVSQVTRIEPFEKGSHVAVLITGSRLPVSRRGYQKLKLVLGI